MKRTEGNQCKGPEAEYTEQELLDMKPAKDASPEEWRAWHQMLYDAGWLRPPEPSK